MFVDNRSEVISKNIIKSCSVCLEIMFALFVLLLVRYCVILYFTLGVGLSSRKTVYEISIMKYICVEDNC